MPLLPRRFARIKSVLNSRMSNLTVLLEHVDKPHNLSAILRSCDAAGVLEVHTVASSNRPTTFNSTAQGSQKWVTVNSHLDINDAVKDLKGKGFKLYGATLDPDSLDYQECNFCGPTAFVLGTEKWGLSDNANKLMDAKVFIPMRGMVQSLNVSVASAALLFEAVRQRKAANLLPINGEGLSKEIYKEKIFEWAYPEVAKWCQEIKKSYPEINNEGVILEDLPRNIRLPH